MGEDTTKPVVLCPSSPCSAGSVLLGFVKADGAVAFISETVVIDADFVQVARAGRTPEKRFRFASPCQAKRCVQWSESRCGVIDSVIGSARLGPELQPTSIANCSIRDSCRWFLQAGFEACQVCSFVITDPRTGSEAIAESDRKLSAG